MKTTQIKCEKCEKWFKSEQALRCHQKFSKICSTDILKEIKSIFVDKEESKKVFKAKGPYESFKQQWEGLLAKRNKLRNSWP